MDEKMRAELIRLRDALASFQGIPLPLGLSTVVSKALKRTCEELRNHPAEEDIRRMAAEISKTFPVSFEQAENALRALGRLEGAALPHFGDEREEDSPGVKILRFFGSSRMPAGPAWGRVARIVFGDSPTPPESAARRYAALTNGDNLVALRRYNRPEGNAPEHSFTGRQTASEGTYCIGCARMSEAGVCQAIRADRANFCNGGRSGFFYA